ncbi:hypothetical protein LRP50_08405 [Enterovibrio sp. ZSDZ42]|uniref:PilZ domain-containing protein n=1 Tax=Enterovibrio gelatinilyticus TaxID=2899819 RepID=A0ABT5QYQ5_9GAMM|nr:hypothetical protein [Enterovibrio sp. ZSDZ42]MDD1793144.1 hypothetical protein [Enterovibrio sp. ZSDZ42]
MAGRRDPNEYKIIEAVLGWDNRRGATRLTPLEGQGFDCDMHIECSKDIRSLPVGSVVRLKVTLKNPKTTEHQPHLYSSYKWSYELVKKS